MTLLWQGKLADYADEERRERLRYQQENGWIRFAVWTMAAIVSAACWGLVLTVGRWAIHLVR